MLIPFKLGLAGTVIPVSLSSYYNPMTSIPKYRVGKRRFTVVCTGNNIIINSNTECTVLHILNCRPPFAPPCLVCTDTPVHTEASMLKSNTADGDTKHLCLLWVCNMHFGSSNLGVTNWELPGRHSEGSKLETNPARLPQACGMRYLTFFL